MQSGGRAPLHLRMVELQPDGATGAEPTYWPHNALLGGAEGPAEVSLSSRSMVEYTVSFRTAAYSSLLLVSLSETLRFEPAKMRSHFTHSCGRPNPQRPLPCAHAQVTVHTGQAKEGGLPAGATALVALGPRGEAGEEVELVAPEGEGESARVTCVTRW